MELDHISIFIKMETKRLIKDDLAKERKNQEFEQEVQKKLENGEDLYPCCDTSIWLRSCQKEITDPLEGKITGFLPNWLKGTLIRNGPGSWKVGDMTFNHLFDCSALLHRFAISRGRVTYQCRFLQSRTYKRNMAAQRIVVTEFGTKAVSDPCQTIFKRVSAFFSPGELLSDNAMISVYPFGDEFYTFTEAPIIHRIDPTTLDTLERVDVSKHVGIVNHTSHPLIMSDGTVYNLGLNISLIGPSYTIIKFPLPQMDNIGLSESKGLSSFEQATIVATIPVRWPLHPSYMHTFGITDHYFVVVEQPLTVSVPSMIKSQVTNSPLIESLRWYKDEQTMIYLIRRKDGKIHKTFVAEAFFYLHIINQYEEDNNIILDICTYRDASMLDCMYAESLKLIKVDTVNKTWKTWNEKNIFPSEPIFVPAPEPKSEASSGIWGKGLENQVGIIILDAITWKELARAEFTTPSAVPKCLHGWFTQKIF
uniref:Uncharacterized protein n=2 Tax=Timema cristinae TaxID=61476 RepID=A0A7R9CKD2_TIMCR|nr:unnamed protein product [Timema cristinae]